MTVKFEIIPTAATVLCMIRIVSSQVLSLELFRVKYTVVDVKAADVLFLENSFEFVPMFILK